MRERGGVAAVDGRSRQAADARGAHGVRHGCAQGPVGLRGRCAVRVRGCAQRGGWREEGEGEDGKYRKRRKRGGDRGARAADDRLGQQGRAPTPRAAHRPAGHVRRGVGARAVQLPSRHVAAAAGEFTADGENHRRVGHSRPRRRHHRRGAGGDSVQVHLDPRQRRGRRDGYERRRGRRGFRGGAELGGEVGARHAFGRRRHAVPTAGGVEEAFRTGRPATAEAHAPAARARGHATGPFAHREGAGGWSGRRGRRGRSGGWPDGPGAEKDSPVSSPDRLRAGGRAGVETRARHAPLSGGGAPGGRGRDGAHRLRVF